MGELIAEASGVYLPVGMEYMSDKPHITALVADDHPLFRAGLREVLEEAHVEVVAEASSGEEAVKQALRTHPTVVVMDVRMPGLDGIEATREIRQQLPATEVVLITGAAEDQGQLFRAIEAGARSYVGKEEGTAIVDAVHAAAQGAAYLTPEHTKLLLASVAGANGRARQSGGSERTLTSRETEVLRLVAQGWHLKDIAAELEVSSRTVGNRVSNIYRKLNTNRRADAVVYAMKAGLISA